MHGAGFPKTRREPSVIIGKNIKKDTLGALQNSAILRRGALMNLFSILAIPAQTGTKPADLTWLAYIDIWIISALVLLAVVVVVGKFIWGRLHRRDEEEYDWYCDDDYYAGEDNEPDNRA